MKLARLALTCLMFLVPIETALQDKDNATCRGTISPGPTEGVHVPSLVLGQGKNYCEMEQVDGKWVPHKPFTMTDCLAAGISLLPIDHYEEWYIEQAGRGHLAYTRKALKRA